MAKIRFLKVDEFDLIPGPSVNFQLTVWKPSHFPTRLEIHAKGIAWRTFVIDGCPVGVKIEDRRTAWRCTVFARRHEWTTKRRNMLSARLRRAYGLDEDNGAFLRLCQGDQGLNRLLGPFSGMRGSCPENLFELAVLAILLQNTTMCRSRDMLDAILRLSGCAVSFDGVDLFCFCTPKALLELGSIRLRQDARVGYRDHVLVSVAEFFQQRPVECATVNRDALMGELCQIKGVGPYTAGIIASSVFRDPRAYGLDVWKRKILVTHLGLGASITDGEIRAYLTSHYAPYEGIVVDALVEYACMSAPVCPLYPTDAAARSASKIWPRPRPRGLTLKRDTQNDIPEFTVRKG